MLVSKARERVSLSHYANSLHAGDAAGLPIDMMVQAIYKLEQHIIWWQRKQSIFEE